MRSGELTRFMGRFPGMHRQGFQRLDPGSRGGHQLKASIDGDLGNFHISA